MNPKVLLAEDDKNLGIVLKEYLQAKDFAVDLVTDSDTALDKLRAQQYEICILDAALPKVDGFMVATELRKLDSNIVLIFVTAKNSREDVIRGFKIGADDYITKPFSVEELILRIQAIMRRVNNGMDEMVSVIKVGKWSFNNMSRKLSSGNEELKLTSKEAELLQLLCANRNRLLKRTTALREIWLDNNYFNSRSMDVYITKLRKYFKTDPDIEIINIHGQGFKLLAPD